MPKHSSWILQRSCLETNEVASVKFNHASSSLSQNSRQLSSCKIQVFDKHCTRWISVICKQQQRSAAVVALCPQPPSEPGKEKSGKDKSGLGWNAAKLEPPSQPAEVCRCLTKQVMKLHHWLSIHPSLHLSIHYLLRLSGGRVTGAAGLRSRCATHKQCFQALSGWFQMSCIIPPNVFWVNPGASYQLDVPRKPLKGGVYEASWSDARTISAGPFWSI